MEFDEVISGRWSVRKFSDTPIEPAKLDAVLNAATLAPTAVNYQPLKIYVFKSDDALGKIRSLCKCTYGAPVVLAVCYDSEQDWKNPLESGVASGEDDAAICATHILLEAYNQGLGSCWVGLFSPTAVREAFGWGENIRPVMLMPLGYPAPDAKPAPKWHGVSKTISELVTEL